MREPDGLDRMPRGIHHNTVEREPDETWRQVIVRKAEPFDQVKPCLTTYQAPLSEFTDSNDSV